MTTFPITNRDRSGWQRRAAGELVRVLDAHADLPVIMWTVGSAGSVLVGRVDGLAPTVQVHADFRTWRQALDLRELAEATTTDGAVTHLSASGSRNQVKIQLVTTVINIENLP